jgi:hypothetical protein
MVRETKMPAQGHLNGDQNQNQFLSPLNELNRMHTERRLIFYYFVTLHVRK